MKKDLIKISFGSKPDDGMNQDQEEQGKEKNHVAVMNEIKQKVMQIEGTEKIVQAIDEFLQGEAQDESEEEGGNKGEGGFKSFSDYFGNKMNKK